MNANPEVPVHDAQSVAERTLATMLRADEFSRWLGIEVVKCAPRESVIRMTVRSEMVNGFGTSHGGIVYALADSAFAFATNSGGELTVAVDCTMSYPRAVKVGDVLTAVGREQESTRRLTFCEVIVSNQNNETVGIFRGTGYRVAGATHPTGAEYDRHNDMPGNIE